MPATTEELLDTSRRELLDLSTRNRLLSIPVDSSSARIVAVRDEISEQVYRLLVGERKAFSFLPREVAVSTADETGESAGGDAEEDLLLDPVLSQPENELPDEDIDEVTGLPKRHVDWGFARAGSRIQSAVKRGISWLMRSDQCISEDGFLSMKGYPIQIRNRENVSSPDLRKPERIAPSEFRAAILAVIELGHGATQKEIPTAVARILGFKNTSAQLRYAVEEQIHKLAKQNDINENNGMFKRAS